MPDIMQLLSQLSGGGGEVEASGGPGDFLGLLGGGSPDSGGEGGGFDTLGVLSESDARRLSLVQALQQLQKPQRTATPMGAIANALMPLLAAPVQARAARQESLVRALPALVSILKLRSDATNAPLEREKLAADVESSKATAALNRRKAADPNFGRAPAVPTELSLAIGAVSRLKGAPATEGEVLEFLQARDIDKLQRSEEAKAPYVEQAIQAREDSANRKRREQRLKGDSVAFDPITLKPVTANEGDVEDGRVLTVTKNQGRILSSIPSTLQDLDELDTLINEFIPEHRLDLRKRANTLASYSKGTEAGGRIEKFQARTNLLAFPVIRMLESSGNISNVELGKVSNPSMWTDSKSTAHAKVDVLRQILLDKGEAWGVDRGNLLMSTMPHVKTLDDGVEVFRKSGAE